jgi:hypothetical protein
LPSFFVLIGLLIVKFVHESPEQGFMALTLEDYNPGVQMDAPRNPIPFNNPGSAFKCQPGECATPAVIDIAQTQEFYGYCGGGYFGSYSGSAGVQQSCVITESDAIVSRITEAGATGVGENVANILDVSMF